MPEYDAAEEAGKLIMDLPNLWAQANLSERRKILMTILDAVYIDVKQSRSILAIKPKPPFKPILQVAVTNKNSRIRVLKEPLNSSPSGSSVFLVEAGEDQPLPRTRVLCFTYISITSWPPVLQQNTS
jgi:hypothetical protein